MKFRRTARGLLALACLAGVLSRPATAQEPSASDQPRRLTLREAIDLGLENNLQAVLAGGQTEEAEGELRQALSRLLPSFEGAVSQAREKINLAAFGLAPPAGESPLVGPFNVFDARLRAEQTLFDSAQSARVAAARSRLDSRRLSSQQARDLVVASVADLYLEALADRARIDAARSQVQTAEAVEQQAKDRHEAGTAAGIDELRAQVALAEEQERLIDAENDLAKQKLRLARAVGLPAGTPVELADEVPFQPLAERDLEDALVSARAARPDLKAAEADVAAAESAVAAIRRQRLPRVEAHGDYGPIGPDPGSAEITYDLALGVTIPLFEGGRIAGETATAEGRAKQARARRDDLSRQVDLEVRSAFLDAAAASRRVAVSSDAKRLATEQVTQARDRFAAGVAGNLEVVQAQEALAAASERWVRSLYQYNRAKLGLALALGVAEESTLPFLQGEQP
ncbi:MAG: TolC family protein [Acidobacteriota bacterium]